MDTTVNGAYTKEQTIERKQRLLEEGRIRPGNADIYTFVNIAAEPTWGGRERDHSDRWIYPAISIHNHGVDVTGRSLKVLEWRTHGTSRKTKVSSRGQAL